MSDEWGPWIEHDGKGCPVAKGVAVEVELRNGRFLVAIALCSTTAKGGITYTHFSAWEWGEKPSRLRLHEVIRYRVRKPKGLAMLESLLADLPAPTPEKATT